MLKLYKRINGRLHYFQASVINKIKGKIHWGVVGDYGRVHVVRSWPFRPFKPVIQQVVYMKVDEGYAEIADEDHTLLEIAYSFERKGIQESIDHKNRLEKGLEQLFEDTGLGHREFTISGLDMIEMRFMVVDFFLAKRVLEQHLVNTEYQNYRDIYIPDPTLDEDYVAPEPIC